LKHVLYVAFIQRYHGIGIDAFADCHAARWHGKTCKGRSSRATGTSVDRFDGAVRRACASRTELQSIL